MLYNYLRQSDTSESLLLFFNGWGMDSLADAGLFDRGWGELTASLIGPAYNRPDILEFYDYTELNCPADLLKFNSRYRNIYLLSWSLGVAAAALILPPELILTKAIAVNGTVVPVSTEYGIAPTIFQGTIDNWSEESRTAFNRRICRGKEQLASFAVFQPQRPVASQKQELIALQYYFSQKLAEKPKSSRYDLAMVGLYDKIFLSQSQIAFWQSQATEIVTMETPHWPLSL